jgi:hypothetical protein
MFNPSARPAVTSGYAWLPISSGTTVSGAEARDRSADRHLETSNLIGSSRRLITLRCHVKKKLLYSHLHEAAMTYSHNAPMRISPQDRDNILRMENRWPPNILIVEEDRNYGIGVFD